MNGQKCNTAGPPVRLAVHNSHPIAPSLVVSRVKRELEQASIATGTIAPALYRALQTDELSPLASVGWNEAPGDVRDACRTLAEQAVASLSALRRTQARDAAERVFREAVKGAARGESVRTGHKPDIAGALARMSETITSTAGTLPLVQMLFDSYETALLSPGLEPSVERLPVWRLEVLQLVNEIARVVVTAPERVEYLDRRATYDDLLYGLTEGLREGLRALAGNTRLCLICNTDPCAPVCPVARLERLVHGRGGR